MEIKDVANKSFMEILMIDTERDYNELLLLQ